MGKLRIDPHLIEQIKLIGRVLRRSIDQSIVNQ
jgi:hypothetical protein